MEQHIIAISGGGFSEIPNAYIDQYVLNVKRQTEPLRIGFIATASNDAPGYIDKFYKAFKHEIPTHISVADFQSPTIQDTVNALDIIYVGGGNTKFMLDTWRKTDFDTVLKTAYANGVILAGISAGAMCWFEHCYSSEGDHFNGLGLLRGALLPHADADSIANFLSWANDKQISPAYHLQDEENLHFINGKLVAKIIERGITHDTV